MIKNVKKLGRATSGVRLMRLNKDDGVASVTILEKISGDSEKKPINKIKKPPKPKKLKRKITKKKPKKILKKTIKKTIKKKIKKPLDKLEIKKKIIRNPKPKITFKKKTIDINKPKNINEPNYWGKDNSLWKKKKI